MSSLSQVTRLGGDAYLRVGAMQSGATAYQQFFQKLVVQAEQIAPDLEHDDCRVLFMAAQPGAFGLRSPYVPLLPSDDIIARSYADPRYDLLAPVVAAYGEVGYVLTALSEAVVGILLQQALVQRLLVRR